MALPLIAGAKAAGASVARHGTQRRGKERRRRSHRAVSSAPANDNLLMPANDNLEAPTRVRKSKRRKRRRVSDIARTVSKRTVGVAVFSIASFFYLCQIMFGLMYLLPTGIAEIPVLGGVADVAVSTVTDLGLVQWFVLLWAWSVIWIGLGYLTCGSIFMRAGAKLLSGRNVGMKKAVFIGALLGDTMPIINVFFPGLVLWVWFIFLIPE